MSTATTNQSPALAVVPAARGFAGLACVRCGAADCVSLDLDDLRTFRCRSCGEEFTADDVRAVLARWRAVLAWAEAAPALPE